MKAIPGAVRKGRKNQFDTIIALENNDAESTGVQGEDLQLIASHFTLADELVFPSCLRYKGWQSQSHLYSAKEAICFSWRGFFTAMVASRSLGIRGVVHPLCWRTRS